MIRFPSGWKNGAPRALEETAARPADPERKVGGGEVKIIEERYSGRSGRVQLAGEVTYCA